MVTPLTARFSVGRRSRNIYSASSAGGLLSSANPTTPSKTGRHSVPPSSSHGRTLNCHKRRYNQPPAYIYGFPTHPNGYFFQDKQNSQNNNWTSSRLLKCALLLLAACFLGAFGLVKRINQIIIVRGETSATSSQYSSTVSGGQTDYSNQNNDMLASTPAIAAALSPPPLPRIGSNDAFTVEQSELQPTGNNQLSRNTLPLYLDVTFFRVPCKDLYVSIFSTGKRDDSMPISINTPHTVAEGVHLNFKTISAVNVPMGETEDSKNYEDAHDDEQPVENAVGAGISNMKDDEDVRMTGNISWNERERSNALVEGYSQVIPKHDFDNAAAPMLEQVGQRFRRRLSRNLPQSQHELHYHRRLENEIDKTKEMPGENEKQDQDVSDEAEITEENPDSDEAGNDHVAKKNQDENSTGLDGGLLEDDGDENKDEKTMEDASYPNQQHEHPQNEGCQITGHVHLLVTNQSNNHSPPRPPTISIQASHAVDSDSHATHSISMDDMTHRVDILKVGSPETFPKEEAMVTVPFVSKTYDTRIPNASSTHHYYRIQDGFHLFPERSPQNMEYQNKVKETQTTMKIPEIQFVFLSSSPSF